MQFLGTVYTEVSDDFQRGICSTARTVKAEKHDLGVIMKVKRLGNIYGEDVGTGFGGNVWDTQHLSPTLTTMQGGSRETMIVAMRGRNPDNPSDRTAGIRAEQRLEPNSQGICNTLTSVQKDNMVMEQTISIPNPYGCDIEAADTYRIRKITPKECWRLMGFSDEDFCKAESVNSNSQLYKQAGNSIVQNVLAAIFGQMIPRKN